MKKQLQVIFLKDTSKWYFWILLALIAKGILFLLALHSKSADSMPIDGFWGSTWGDSGTYIWPIDNLINKGAYTPDFRMPGFGFLYYPLALMLPKAIALNVLIVIQFMLDAIATYCLALTATYIFKKDSLFHLAFYIYIASTFSSLYNTVLMTESLTTSTLIFSTYFFARYVEKGNASTLFWSGLFMTWAIFLRPVFAPLLAVLLLLLFIKRRKVITCIILLIPFALIDGAWTARNYSLYHKIKPLTKSAYYNSEDSYVNHMYSFSEAWGGFHTPGFNWLFSTNVKTADSGKVFPKEIFTTQFNMDSLRTIRELVIKTMDSAGEPGFNLDKYNAILCNRFDKYTLSIKNEHPYLYYVKAPETRIMNFFHISVFSILFFNKIASVYCMYSYYIVLLSGIIGVLLIAWHWRQHAMALLFPFIPFYTFLLHPIIFRLDENRYFVPAFPFLAVCSAFALSCFYSRYFNKKKV